MIRRAVARNSSGSRFGFLTKTLSRSPRRAVSRVASSHASGNGQVKPASPYSGASASAPDSTVTMTGPTSSSSSLTASRATSAGSRTTDSAVSSTTFSTNPPCAHTRYRAIGRSRAVTARSRGPRPVTPTTGTPASTIRCSTLWLYAETVWSERTSVPSMSVATSPGSRIDKPCSSTSPAHRPRRPAHLQARSPEPPGQRDRHPVVIDGLGHRVRGRLDGLRRLPHRNRVADPAEQLHVIAAVADGEDVGCRDAEIRGDQRHPACLGDARRHHVDPRRVADVPRVLGAAQRRGGDPRGLFRREVVEPADQPRGRHRDQLGEIDLGEEGAGEVADEAGG